MRRSDGIDLKIYWKGTATKGKIQVGE